MRARKRASRLTLSILLSVLLLGLMASSAFAAGDALTIDSVQASGFPKITLRMTVSDSHGAPIPRLQPQDFVVLENGKNVGPVAAYPLAQSPTPLSMVVAIDVSGSMNDQGKLTAAKAAAKEFLSRLRPVDQVEVIAFSDKVTTVVPFTHDQTTLDKGIDNLKAKGSTALYDATDHALNDVLRASGTRVVVVLTDGEDTTSKAKISNVLDRAKQASVPIDTIGLGGDVRDAVLQQMAAESAGHYFKAPTAADLTAAFSQLTQQLYNEYELYYFSPGQEHGGQPADVVVQVHRAGIPTLQRKLTYVVPAVPQADPGRVDPGQLQAVPEPALAPAARSLPSYPPGLAAALAFVAILCVFGGLALRVTKDPLDVRLATFVGGASRATRARSSDQQGGQLGRVVLEGLAALALRLLPASQIEHMRRSLLLAGSPNGWDVQQFAGLRVLATILLGLLGYLAGLRAGPSLTILLVVAFGVLGYMLPVIWLGSKIKTRQREIFRAMPNVLDLLSVSVVAGLGLDQAIVEVCAKFHNELTREFALYVNEIRMGRPRHEALRAMVTRTDVPELSGFVTAVIQADELGSGIADTLNAQAEQIRIRRRQYAEKLAHEAAIKMVFPMVFLMFPAIFIVLLGPAIPQILGAFSGAGK